MKKKPNVKSENKLIKSFVEKDLFSCYFRGVFLDNEGINNLNFSVVHLETDGGRINAICPNSFINDIESTDLIFKIEIIESKNITIKYQNEDIIAPLVFVCKVLDENSIDPEQITDLFDEMGLSKNLYKKISNELKDISTNGTSSIFEIKAIEKIVNQYVEIRKNPADLKDLETSNENVLKFLDYLCDYYDNLTYIEIFDEDSIYHQQFDIIQIVDDGKKLKHIFSLYFKDGLSCKIIDLNKNEIQFFDLDLFNIFEELNKRLEIYYHIKAKDNEYSKFYKEFFRECFVPSSNLTQDLKDILDTKFENKEKIFTDKNFIELTNKTRYIYNYSLNKIDYSKYDLDFILNEKPCESSIFLKKCKNTLMEIEVSFITITKYYQALENAMLKYIHCDPEDKDLGLESLTSKLGLSGIFDRFIAEQVSDTSIPEERKNLIVSYKFEIIKNRNYLYHIFLIEFLKIFNSPNTDITSELETYKKKLASIEKFTLYVFKSLFPESKINESYNLSYSLETNSYLKKFDPNTLLANYFFQLSTLYLKIENHLYYLLAVANNKMDDSQKFSAERILTMRKNSMGEYIKIIEKLPKIFNNNYLLIACADNGIDFKEFTDDINKIRVHRNYWVHKSLLQINLFNKSGLKKIDKKLSEIKFDYESAKTALQNIDKLIKILK